jgi:2',3'-cyclic-nucleotide 2'-phosphodiesterase (5'-nucleotidase family)
VEKCIFLLTGDLHGKLSAEAEARLAAARQEDPNILLLDAGDAAESGNLDTRVGKNPILARMGRIGYDAMVMGNRESHPLRGALEKKLAPASFPVLAANVMAKRQPLPGRVRSHIVRCLPNQVKIAIIGLTTQITAPESWWSRVTDYVFDNPEKTAAGLTAKLRPQVDVLVLLSHCGIAIDRKLALIEGVDLVLGGHSHLELMEETEGAPILHSGFMGHKLGRAEVTLECQKIVKIATSLEVLDESSPNRPRRKSDSN